MQTYTLDRSGASPLYEQLYRALKADILSGALPGGSRLPSGRALAEHLGLSRVTVETAYAQLLAEGYLTSRPRAGYFVEQLTPQELPPRVSEPEAQPPEPETAQSRSAQLFPFSVWARLMRGVLLDRRQELLRPAPDAGLPALRQAVAAELYRQRGVHVSPEQVYIGAGAEYLYSLAAQLLGREIVYALESPSYEKIRLVYEANGAQCAMLRLGEDGIRSDELASCRAGALHVTPFHSYPSGVTATAAKRREYAAWARERGAYIIEDDYDSEFSALFAPIETVFSVAPERVIYINSFSKTIAPAMRTGYMVLPAPLVARFEARLGFYSCTVPVYEQYVLAEFIRSGELERCINRRRRALRQKAKPPRD